MPSRLDIEFHDLELAINGADAEACRRVAEAVAAAAVQQADLTDDTIRQGLDDLRRQVPTERARRRELEALVDRLDNIYWDLEEEASDPSCSAARNEAARSAFERARAANAVLYAGSDDPTEAAHEAAYEAHHVLRDPARLRAIVEASLQLT